MSEEYYNLSKEIHIYCPYCWTEFHNFEQIGKYIDYNYHLYQEFVVLPIEHASFFPHYIQKEPFGDNQKIEKIQCSGCEREYTIIFLPWGIFPGLANVKVDNDEKKLCEPITKKIKFINI